MSVPSAIGRFQVLRRIARGGMGTLYLAWDPKLDRQIAIKVLSDDNEDLRERFAREARSAARLHHPHIVTIFDVGEHDGEPFIAMEYVQGETLAAVIRNRVPLTTARKLEIIEQLAEGLAYAHKVGVIHRDVKPANIMIALDGSVKILDFGIARIGAGTSNMTLAGMLMGTLSYMSPEQAGGQPADNRSDVFAVGAVLYELLSYQQAFPGGFGDGILHRVMHTAPAPLEELCPGLDSDIVRVVEKALEKDPAQRYQDLGAMSSEIRRIRSRLPEEPPAVGSTDATMPPMNAPLRPASTPQPSSRRGGDREELQRRRAKQIEDHLAAARDALVSGAYEAAISACEQVLMIDAENERAIEILDRARTILDERQAEQWLGEAQQEIERGALTSALAKIDRAAALHATPRAAELRKLVDEAIAARERARQRAEALRRHVDQAQELFDRGAFQEAIAAADAALELEPGHAEAQDVKARAIEVIQAHERELLERRARDAVREARRMFAADDHAGALERLEQFTPPHEVVSATLEQLRGEAARIATQRRLEAEKRARRELIQAELAFARVEIDARDFAGALQRLRGLNAEELAPAADALIEEAEARQKEAELAEQRANEVAEHVARAAGLLARQDFEGALSRVDAALALAPDHKAARALRAKVEARLRALAEARAAEEARRRERDEAVARAIATANQTQNHQAAIAALREALDLDPEHQEAQKLLALREDALAREEAERIRRQQAETARRKQVQQLMIEARHAADRDDFAAARQAIDRVLELDPAYDDARALADDIASAEAAARTAQEPPAATTIFVAPVTQAVPAITTASASPPVAPPIEPASVAEAPASAPALAPPTASAAGTAAAASSASASVRTPAAAGPRARASKTSRIYWFAGTLSAVFVLFLVVWLVGPGRPEQTATNTTASAPPPASAPSTATPPAAAAPAPPPARAETTTPASPPASTSAPGPTADDVRQSAREQLARGQREQSLDTIAAGLKKWPEDTQLKAMLSSALVDARARVKTAREEATRNRASAGRQAEYRDAAKREQQVASLARAGRSEEAVRTAWSAADLYARAASAAKAASAEAARQPVPAPPATTTRAEAAPSPSQPPVQQAPTPTPAPAAPPAPVPTPAPPPVETAPVERPAPTPPAPAPAPPPPTTVPPARGNQARPQVDDAATIRRVLQEYADAYTRLDAVAVKRLFPAVNEQALRQSFAGTKSQQVQIQNETIAINGTTATVSCIWSMVFTGQVGGVQRAAPRITVRLQKTGDNWTIVDRR